MNHPFKIGGIFANRDGVYRVLDIDTNHNQMLVSYIDTDEDAVLTISTQQQILENMSIETQTEAQEKARKLEMDTQGYGDKFDGLKPGEFSQDITGTTWRSRQNLAGRIAKLLSNPQRTPHRFLSKAIYPWQVVYLSHSNRILDSVEWRYRMAKYRIEVDDSGIYYGFYIERSNKVMDNDWDWCRFKQSLETNENLQKLIRNAEEEYEAEMQAIIYNTSTETEAKICWNRNSLPKYALMKRFQILLDISKGLWIDFHVQRFMPKTQAIERGENLGQDIADFLAYLYPLYQASIK